MLKTGVKPAKLGVTQIVTPCEALLILQEGQVTEQMRRNTLDRDSFETRLANEWKANRHIEWELVHELSVQYLRAYGRDRSLLDLGTFRKIRIEQAKHLLNLSRVPNVLGPKCLCSGKLLYAVGILTVLPQHPMASVYWEFLAHKRLGLAA
jgi:hypothetical protein